MPVTPETRFQAASISKSVAALAALLLVNQGRISLDGDVNRQLFSWKVPMSHIAKNKTVSVRGLLSHSSGLNVHGFDGYTRGKDKVPNLLQVLDGLGPANSEAVRLIHTPGSRLPLLRWWLRGA